MYVLQTDEAINWFQKRLKNAVNYGLSSEDNKLFGKNYTYIYVFYHINIFIFILEIFITSTLSDVDIKKQINNTVIPSFFENIVTRKVNKSVRILYY